MSACDADAIRSLLSRTPALRPFLMRYARRVLRGGNIPESFLIRDIDYASQGELERLLGTMMVRRPDGSATGRIPGSWRNPSAWSGVVQALDLLKEPTESAAVFLTRLSWQVPSRRALIERISEIPQIMRYLSDYGNRAIWRRLFLSLTDWLDLEQSKPVTLSQLGSDWLNDSKALREGALRRQLEYMLAAVRGEKIISQNLLQEYGIEDNPYTSQVTVFAPIVLILNDGTKYDFPLLLYEKGLVAMLPAEIVSLVRAIEWHCEQRIIITSENAAPFSSYVKKGYPALYTAGYPNVTVLSFLGLLSSADVTAIHAGDADLDGFRIAAIIANSLPVRRVLASEVVHCPGNIAGIPLSDEQRQRLSHFLSQSSDTAFAEEIKSLIEQNCWYEQESFPDFSPKMR